MSISFVGQATGITSASLPTFQVNDVAITFAFDDGSTIPTLPAGWTDIQSDTTADRAFRYGYRVLQSGDTTTGTWTNATAVVVMVYRGVKTSSPIGAEDRAALGNTSVRYLALTLTNTSGSSWIVAFAGHKSIDTTLETAPAGMTNRADYLDALNEAVGHDTNGGVSSWAQVDVPVGGTQANWDAGVIELLAAGGPIFRGS